MSLNGFDFGVTIADVFVFCYRYPFVLSYEGDPFFIGSVGCEMVIMDFDRDCNFTQSSRNHMFTEISVQIEYELFRLRLGVRNGSLLRFPLLCVHSPEITL